MVNKEGRVICEELGTRSNEAYKDVGHFSEADEKTLKISSNGMTLSFLLFRKIARVHSGKQIGSRLEYGLEGAQEEIGGKLI